MKRGGIERGGRSDSSVRFAAKAAQSVSVAHYENFPVASRLIPAPLQHFRDLLSAFRQDVVQPRYAEFAQVLDYCSRSANPIGRLLLRLYHADDVEHCRLADAICTGLQLTNFWQDVALDWRKGRVYLPAEDLARFGVAESQIAEGRCDPRWSQLMAFEVARTRALLEAGRPLA